MPLGTFKRKKHIFFIVAVSQTQISEHSLTFIMLMAAFYSSKCLIGVQKKTIKIYGKLILC